MNGSSEVNDCSDETSLRKAADAPLSLAPVNEGKCMTAWPFILFRSPQ